MVRKVFDCYQSKDNGIYDCVDLLTGDLLELSEGELKDLYAHILSELLSGVSSFQDIKDLGEFIYGFRKERQLYEDIIRNIGDECSREMEYGCLEETIDKTIRSYIADKIEELIELEHEDVDFETLEYIGDILVGDDIYLAGAYGYDGEYTMICRQKSDNDGLDEICYILNKFVWDKEIPSQTVEHLYKTLRKE